MLTSRLVRSAVAAAGIGVVQERLRVSVGVPRAMASA
jgi:hypothetical protein